MILEVFAVCCESELTKNQYDTLFKIAPPEKREQVKKQKIKHNADNTLIGIALVMAGVSKTFNIPVQDVEVGYQEDGKPYIKNHENIFVSISHSGNLIVCAVSDRQVGIDAEKIRKYNEPMAKKVFSRDVVSSISGSDSLYTKEWTRLEAALKLSGQGISGLGRENAILKDETESIQLGDFWITVAYENFKEDNS